MSYRYDDITEPLEDLVAIALAPYGPSESDQSEINKLGERILKASKRQRDALQIADRRIKYLESHLSDAQAPEEVQELLREVVEAHRDKSDPYYNECEIDQCEWCTEAWRWLETASESNREAGDV